MIIGRRLCSMSEDGSLVLRGIPIDHGPYMIGQGVVVAHERQIANQRKMEKKVRHDRRLLPPNQIALEQIQEIA